MLHCVCVYIQLLNQTNYVPTHVHCTCIFSSTRMSITSKSKSFCAYVRASARPSPSVPYTVGSSKSLHLVPFSLLDFNTYDITNDENWKWSKSFILYIFVIKLLHKLIILFLSGLSFNAIVEAMKKRELTELEWTDWVWNGAVLF